MRDPAIDATRAVAVLGVITGHWLVTATVTGADGLNVDSPLRWSHDLVALSWLLQTLGLFFFAAGFAATRSRTPWWRKAWALAIPVAIVLASWAVIVGVLRPPKATVSTIIHLVTTPLWFLGVYLVLLILTPVMRWLDSKIGGWAVVGLAVLAVAAEATGLGDANVLVVWWIPWQIGIVVARTGFVQAWGVPLLVIGVAGYALSVRFGFPVSAVGGTGEPRSNLAPPSPAALSLALAQIGIVLLVARWLRAGKIISWVNERALALFLVHQSALLTVTLVVGAFTAAPGLLSSPADPAYPLVRLVWLPVFAVALLGWLGLLRITGGRLAPGRGRDAVRSG